MRKICLLFFVMFVISIFSAIGAQESIETRVESILNQMTMDEKVGQMVQIERSAISAAEVGNYFIGSVLSGGNDVPAGITAEKLADMIDPYFKQAMNTRLKIPLIYGIDSVHGFSSIVGTVVFPHNIGMGATHNPTLTEKKAVITADETAATGIRWAFAPCIAVVQDIRWGRTYESFGENTKLVSSLGAATVKGLQGELTNSWNIAACAKHYIGDGATEYGTGSFGAIDQGDAKITEEVLRNKFLPPYSEAVKAGVKTIMVSYSGWNGVKMHMQKYLITDILKGELKFQGFVVSDYDALLELPGNSADQINASVNAGIDMFMLSKNYMDFINTVKALVKDGKIPVSRIDDAVSRIIKVKLEMGLFEKPFADKNLLKDVGSKEHREAARECVRESMVLLKNQNGILPLSKKVRKIFVAGKSADDIGNQCGGWTVTWQGGSGNTTSGTTILQAIKKTVDSSTKVVYDKSGNGASGADAAIVVAGEKPYAEFFGDIYKSSPSALWIINYSKSLKLSDEDLRTIDNVKKAGIPLVIILISGRPLLINDVLDKSDAFIAAWLPGTEGQGVADVIFGDYNPTGRLSFSWPKDESQIPVGKIDSGNQPLFPFGYGLNY